jgi:hypothetical protein
MAVGGQSGVSRLRRSRQKNPFTRAKAKKILSEKKPTLQGQPISEAQRGLLGLIAGGKKPTRLKVR